MSVKPVVAVAAALVLAGCVNTPSPSITPSATGASATPTSSKSSIAAMRFTQPERDLLAATGRSAFDADADQYVGTAHGLCTSMQSLGDAGIARMLNQAEEHRAREIVLISTFLCPSVLDAVKAGAQGRGKFVDGTYYVGTGPGELPPGKYRTEGPANRRPVPVAGTRVSIRGPAVTLGWQTFERVGTVNAVRLDDPLEWLTPEGAVMRGERGDWLVTDPSGGRRTVKDASFRATHTHEQGHRWRRTTLVRARPAEPGETIQTHEGPVVAADGPAWVVRDRSGAEWLVPDQHFRRAYRRHLGLDESEPGAL